jgi:hypothetical protein
LGALGVPTDSRHAGQIYDLTGPALSSFSEALNEIAKVTGRSLRFTPVSSDAYGESLAPYLPAAKVTFLVELFGLLLDGHNALLSDGVERAGAEAARLLRLRARRRTSRRLANVRWLGCSARRERRCEKSAHSGRHLRDGS